MSWVARWRGEELAAAPELRVDGWWVWLSVPAVREGFELLTEDGPWVRTVPVAECEAVLHRRTVARWRGVACVVVGERPDGYLLQDAGGDAAAAGELGFERVDVGVRRRWVPRGEVEQLEVEERGVTG
ncbi:hypothetical protein SAMN03159343_0900 [Klenkia marina]|uniref:Uncharacterized protein n=1 Tax=Klenkia marina TaxID=1960309 RepID=A0A1G4XG90_9ACTN|nr:hypothetical protein [Klenkia marina]SCX40175.1 hypothetical protein SAMN03159343_0900 [Klenkia marina]